MKLPWLVLLVAMTVCESPGVLSQFSPPSSDICSGSDIEFSCVGNSLSVSSTRWEITADGGGDRVCTVAHNVPGETDTCGPGGIFTSSLDVDAEVNYTSSLRAEDVPLSLNRTVVECVDGGSLQTIGSATICVINLLESSRVQGDTVSGVGDEENMCVLSVEWSETIVSCGRSVTYNLTVTPCPSGSGDCDMNDMTFSGWEENQHSFTVNGSVSLEYELTVSTVTCGDVTTSPVYRVDLSADSEDGSFNYYFLYNLSGQSIEAVIVSWPRFYIGDTDAVYRVVIDPPGEVVADVGAETCTGEMCRYIYSSNTLTNSSTVSVDVVGCVTERMDATDISTLCDPEDLLTSGVSWSEEPVIQDGEGVYSFPGGNVTYNGVSLGSTATYRTSVDYRVNGAQLLESRCEDGMWTPEALIVPAECPQGLLPCNITTAAEIDNMTCCTVDGQTSVCVSYTGVSIGNTATYTTSDNFCIDNKVLTRSCTSDMMWEDITPTAIRALERQKLSGWNFALIIVGVILFVVGVCIAIALAVLLILRIIAGWKVKVWYWVLVGVSAFITLVVLILWIVLAAFVSNNEFVEGGFYEDSGKWRQDNSLCETTAPNSVKNGLGVACFLLSFVVIIGWVACLFLMKWGLRPPPNKPFIHNVTELGAVPPVDETDMYDVPDKKPTSPLPLLDKKEHSKGKPNGVHYGQLDHAYKKKIATVTPAPTSPTPAVPLASATAEGEYGKLDRTQIQDYYGKLDHPGKKKTRTLPAAAASADESQYGKLDPATMEDPLHYGKLDHPGKRVTTLPASSAGEYRKLDRTQVQEDPDYYGKLDHPGKKKTHTLPAAAASADESQYGKLDPDPLHYGKLDHPGKRVTTLPASSAGEYRKLDRTQMQVKQGKPGDVYDVVTNEPRHVPSKKSKKDDH